MALEALALADFSRTELAGELPKVSRAVQAQGEVVITSHNKPEMVLMTVERYLALQEAGRPAADRLTEEFDALFQKMQEKKAPDGAAAAFAMSGEELGRIALAAAQRDKLVRK